MDEEVLKSKVRARAIAFYLPQYFPIPENDVWWGPGFTEWVNVAKARPLFKGHQQPDLPGELGFYDLRLSETREAQAALASAYGIEGFCFWHYWFGNGKQILERQLSEVLKSGKPDFPFCVCWANQTWSRTWEGSKVTLIEQTYPGERDQQSHFDLLETMFRDPRYICVDGKPLFLIYSPSDLPDPVRYVQRWRDMANKAGLLGLYIVGMSNQPDNTTLRGFDKLMMFGPADYIINQSRLYRAIHRDLGPRLNHRLPNIGLLPARYNYNAVADTVLNVVPRNGRYLPSVMPNWDNTPRSRQRGIVYEGATPERFERLLGRAIDMVADNKPSERIVFIKAWNEWAEGNYLEPDRRYGRARLEAVGRALGRNS